MTVIVNLNLKGSQLGRGFPLVSGTVALSFLLIEQDTREGPGPGGSDTGAMMDIGQSRGPGPNIESGARRRGLGPASTAATHH